MPNVGIVQEATFTMRRGLAVTFCAAMYFAVQHGSLMRSILLWFGFLVLEIVVARAARVGVGLFAALSLYAVSAYVALIVGRQNFPPWPSESVVTGATSQALLSVVVATGLCELLVGAERIGLMLQGASARAEMLITWRRSGVVDLLLSILLLLVGIADTLRLVETGIGTVLGGSRREYANVLLLGGDHNVQLVCIGATVVLIVRRYLIDTGAIPIVAVVVGWLPYLLVGSRKELVTTAAICVILLGRHLRRGQKLAIAAGGVGVFALPWFTSGDPYLSLHEFILPQSMQFAVSMGLVPPSLGGTFAERAQFLLPAPLRFTEIVDFGHAFFELRLTGVGVGASPFGEAILVAGEGLRAVWFFGVVFAGWLLLLRLVVNRLPLVVVVGYGMLLVYGRSDFWTMVFFVVYVSMLIRLLAWLPIDASVLPTRPRWTVGRREVDFR